jgi:hypothetical protein
MRAIRLAALSTLLVWTPAAPGDDPPKVEQAAPGVTLTPDQRSGPQLMAAADYIADGDWKNALRLLQHLLDRQEDVLAAVKRQGPGGEASALVSVRGEAQRLLAALPEAGREFYEKTYGPDAADLLKQARLLGDDRLLAEVARRYLFTASGLEAVQDLARAHYRAGHGLAAALRYEQQLPHRGVARWPAEDLYQAALALRRANRRPAAETIGKELLNRAGARSC